MLIRNIYHRKEKTFIFPLVSVLPASLYVLVIKARDKLICVIVEGFMRKNA